MEFSDLLANLLLAGRQARQVLLRKSGAGFTGFKFKVAFQSNHHISQLHHFEGDTAHSVFY